jgi:HEAT repeat protein
MTKTAEDYIAQLTSDDLAAQAAAAEALARLGAAAQPAAVALVEASGSSDANVCQWANAALEELGPPTANQIAPLVNLARDPNCDTSYWAITLLGRAGQTASAAVPVLAELIRSAPELSHRERAVWALGKMGQAAQPALPALREAAASSDPRLSRLAKSALEAIGA